MNFVHENVKRANKKNGTARPNGSTRTTTNLDRNKKPATINERNKKDWKKTADTSHVNSGVIGSKQLQSIYNLVGDVRQRMPGDGKENQEVISRSDVNDRPLTKTDDEMISSVMQQIAELNRDKLSEESMVKVLSAVYLDAKAKLSGKNKSNSTLFTDRLNENSVQQPETVVPISQGENVPVVESANTGDKSGTPNRPLTISERKRIQWEKEKAELEAMKVHDPWNKPTFMRTTAPAVVTAPSQAGPPLISSVSWSCSDQGLPVTASSALPPALTPMAFATHEEAERARKEEQRRQWKAELDQQVLEQRLLQEKIRLEEQRKTEALLNQMTLQQMNAQPFTSFQSAVGNPGLSNNMTYPVSGPVTAHPSASHFTSTTFLPTTLIPPNSMSGVSMQCTPAPNVPISVMSNVTFPSSSSASFVGSTVSTAPSVARTTFNRTRGFTQQIYVDSAESAERARLAHEARMENLRQIEEKQRRKEQEKAQRLLEEKLDEERLAREQAELKAIAEAENEERLRREEIERQQVQQLHANLLEARQAVERNRAMRYNKQKQTTAAGDFVQSAPRTISSGVEPTQTTPSVPNMVPDRCQSIRPPDLQMFTAPSVAAVPMMPTMPMAQPFTNLLYLPQQVPMISSSYMQNTYKEDAEVQTEQSKTENIKRNLVPRCARETGPGRVGNKLISAQSKDAKNGYSVPPRSNNAVKPRSTASTVELKTNQRLTNTKSSSSNANALKGKMARSTAALTGIPNKNSDCSYRGQTNGDGDRSRSVEDNSIARVDADVMDTDYHGTTYTASNPDEGFVPHHCHQSRQIKHTGFSPSPELPETTTKSKPNRTAPKRSPIGRSARSSQPVPTRIPVPAKQPSTIPKPTQLNPTSDTPIRIQKDPSYTVGPLNRIGYDSLDLVRTHDVLNPLEANSSLPISREPSASVQAREAYKKSSNPALYGDPPVKSANSSKVTKDASAPNTANKRQMQTRNTQNDPILNPGLVREHPTPRQDTILRHLSQIRQELKMKRELYESGNYDDEDD